MKNFKNYPTIAAGLVIMTALLLVPISESKSHVNPDTLRLLATVSMVKAQTASDEASRAAEKQRTLVKSLTGNGNSSIGGGIGAKAAEDNDEQQRPGRLTSREMARERAVLQQLEASARRSAEVLESVKRLGAEVDRQPRR